MANVDHDEAMADLRQVIADHGWAVRHVGAGEEFAEVEFTYTIGFTQLRHPEVVIQGMPVDSAHTFLNLIGDEITHGRRFEPEEQTDELTEPGYPVVFITASDTSGLTAVAELYGTVTALQMVWCDTHGHLPWDPEFRNPPGTQPLLGLPPRP